MVGIFGMGCAEFDYQMICAIFILSSFFHSDTFLEAPIFSCRKNDELLLPSYFYPIPRSLL